ncbi:recombinase family protein [Pseudacidovorax intermedius]|uniref:recombinase family protein n=1 Tax=Pseudacidovorax intermedius TaxID=433924 RepID=UPI00069CC0FA|nr:recombinase family protein [Pseudacidovorax intermedius]
MKVGYARVSTDEQSVDLQIRALERAGCDALYTDQGVSGAVFDRPGLTRALRRLRAGDTLVVWKLDRLGRSVNGLVQVVSTLGKRRIHFASLSESIDTGTPGGILIFHLMGALAEFERSLISERTKAGMEAARGQGRHVGRPRSLSAEQLDELALYLGREPVHMLARKFDVHTRTLRRYIQTLESPGFSTAPSCEHFPGREITKESE